MRARAAITDVKSITGVETRERAKFLAAYVIEDNTLWLGPQSSWTGAVMRNDPNVPLNCGMSIDWTVLTLSVSP